MKREEIFKILFKPFFKNGKAWIGARPLTKDDFDFKILDVTKEQAVEKVKNKYGSFIGIQLTMTMKDSTIKMLDKYPYFERYGKIGFDNLPDSEKKAKTTFTESVIVDLKVKLKTPSGGQIRNEKKVSDVIDKAIVELRDDFDNSKEELINKILETVNRYVQATVKENNDNYKIGVVRSLTSRDNLDELLELNKGVDDVASIKEKHDIKKGKLDAEIEVYRKKIEALEAEKAEVYEKTSKEFFGDDLKELPEEVKKEIENKKGFKQTGRSPFLL